VTRFGTDASRGHERENSGVTATSNQPLPLKILVVGAGVAGLEATLALRDLAEERVEIEVLAPDTEFRYRPMSVAEPFLQGEARAFPVRRLVELAGASLRPGTLAKVDLDRHRVTTADGDELEWDVLLLALGGRPREGVSGALTFRGPESTEELSELLDDALAGRVESLAFALPTRAAWPLPLYELALMTSVRLADSGGPVRLELVTPEDGPLAIFGPEAESSIRDLLESHGIIVHTQTTPVVFRQGRLMVVPGSPIHADRVVAMPVLEGPRIQGLPQDARGFVTTDEHGRVEGREDVYAAGDLTAFPIKQGGIATQQADAAAASIAALGGATVAPEPFRPMLRGVLLTGLTPRYLRADPLRAEAEIDTEPLWWPPAKIVGRYLAPFLAKHVGLAAERLPESMEAGALKVDVELDRLHGTWAESTPR
jgi:sulfide:quinone oxidoreductase